MKENINEFYTSNDNSSNKFSIPVTEFIIIIKMKNEFPCDVFTSFMGRVLRLITSYH